MHKNLMKFFAFAMISLSLISCNQGGTAEIQAPEIQSAKTNEEEVSQSDTAKPSDQSGFLWQITVAETVVYNELHTVTPVTQYDGSVVNINYDQVPGQNNCYILVNLAVKKASAGNSVFSWADLVLQDAQGISYNRHENDIFLSDHGYKRMVGSDLKLGTNEGWICFEVPKSAAEDVLTLIHHAQEGENIVAVRQ